MTSEIHLWTGNNTGKNSEDEFVLTKNSRFWCCSWWNPWKHTSLPIYLHNLTICINNSTTWLRTPCSPSILHLKQVTRVTESQSDIPLYIHTNYITAGAQESRFCCINLHTFPTLRKSFNNVVCNNQRETRQGMLYGSSFLRTSSFWNIIL